MALSLREYAEWLDERNLLWPAPPTATPAKATPAIHPLRGIRAVTWSVYGTLLTVADGRLLFDPQPEIRLQVALEKTIQEFNMWHSMTRHPGAPWEYLLPKYRNAIADLQLAASPKKGDVAEVNLAHVWRKLLDLLRHKDFQYDEAFYGDWDEYSEKVAFFFHRCLQGVQAAPQAAFALRSVAQAGLGQGLLADGQPFTLAHLLRALETQGKLPPLQQLFSGGAIILSSQLGVRKPSRTLYTRMVECFESHGLAPAQILHIGTRLTDDLAIAKQMGFRTALYAGDQKSLAATSAEVKNPDMRPDRLLTDLAQIRDVLKI